MHNFHVHKSDARFRIQGNEIFCGPVKLARLEAGEGNMLEKMQVLSGRDVYQEVLEEALASRVAKI